MRYWGRQLCNHLLYHSTSKIYKRIMRFSQISMHSWFRNRHPSKRQVLEPTNYIFFKQKVDKLFTIHHFQTLYTLSLN
ncbi:hypothetical protein HanRHA438_Chr08g0342851 [Helianthus annuus]|nr:hypothetical protein HanRHA438_Chr08g0342851 [Helianthus annuus]